MDEITFIDLFAGIGGFRLGLECEGFKCVYSCEIDDNACKIYKDNFEENPKGDITKIIPEELPDFDVLCGGFPCQTFSICGKQKGFNDEIRGTLFFDICRILEYKKPKVFFLENVQNLEKHDKGRTLTIMIQTLTQLGYTVNYKVLNAKDFNTPQNRERIVLIGNRNGISFDFEMIKKTPVSSMIDFLDKDGNFEYLNPNDYTIIDNYKIQEKSGLIFIGYRNKRIRTIGVREGTEHLSRVHKQPNRIYSAEGIHPTIASQEQSGRYWILHNGRVRKLTINECFRFMGFPNDFKKDSINSKLYERIGNSICVNMVQAIAKEIKNQIFNLGGDIMTTKSPTQLLEDIYGKASNIKDINLCNLGKNQLNWVKEIYEHEDTFKGVYTVLVTSLLNKNQTVVSYIKI